MSETSEVRERPNVLVVMFDQVAPDALGCYGNPVVKTPTINRLATQVWSSTLAYCNSPLCTARALLA